MNQYSKSSETRAIRPLMSPCRIRSGSICAAMFLRITALSDVGPQPAKRETSLRVQHRNCSTLTANDDRALGLLDFVCEYLVQCWPTRPCTLSDDADIVDLVFFEGLTSHRTFGRSPVIVSVSCCKGKNGRRTMWTCVAMHAWV